MAFVYVPCRGDFHVEAKGSWMCRDGTTGAILPLAGARVELMDSDCDGSEICDDLMGTTHVNDDGTFLVAGDGGDPFNGKPDVYVRVVFNDDQGVRLTDELNRDRGANTPEHDHNDFEGSIDFGTWTTGLNTAPGEGTKCATWIRARQAFRNFISLTGSNPPAGHYDVEYWSGVFAGTPWTNTDTTHWPTHFQTGQVNEHEFGHSVRHAFDGDGAHFAGDAFKFRYARNHELCDSKHLLDIQSVREAFAFNEGWAEFWEGAIGGCNATRNMTVEGDVAAALGDLSSCRGVTKAAMTKVLQANPEAIHSFGDFKNFFDRQFPGACTGMTGSSLTVQNLGARFLSLTVRQRSAQQAVAALSRDIETRTSELRKAVQEAASAGSVCTGIDCEAIFQKLVRPAFLKGSIRAQQLARDRLRTELNEGNIYQGLNDGTFFSRFKEIDGSYQGKLVQIQSDALQEAIRAAMVLVGRSPAAAPLLDRLRIASRKLMSTDSTTMPTRFAIEPVLPWDAPRQTRR